MSKILVQSKPERFRRAGIEFTREGVELDTASVTKAQMQAITDEPLLAISDVVSEEPLSKAKK